MIDEGIFDAIVAEVIRRLTQRLENRGKKALVLFSGGLIGLQESLEQLSHLHNRGWGLTVVLSPAAGEVIGSSRVKEALANAVVYEAADPLPPDLVAGADLVLVPVLTQNTAAKVALGLADTNITYLINRALMAGKTIIAGDDAADPFSEQRRRLGLSHAPASWNKMRRNYLTLLEAYGIRLVKVTDLAEAAVGSEVTGLSTERISGIRASNGQGNRVITRADVMEAWAGEGKLVLKQGAIVTPLARETALEYGVELVPEK